MPTSLWVKEWTLPERTAHSDMWYVEPRIPPARKPWANNKNRGCSCVAAQQTAVTCQRRRTKTVVILQLCDWIWHQAGRHVTWVMSDRFRGSLPHHQMAGLQWSCFTVSYIHCCCSTMVSSLRMLIHFLVHLIAVNPNFLSVSLCEYRVSLTSPRSTMKCQNVYWCHLVLKCEEGWRSCSPEELLCFHGNT